MTETRSDSPRLFTVPSYHRNRTSDVILALAEQCREGDVTLLTLTRRLGDRTFGILLILFAVFNVIPFVSFFSGLLASSLGIQMMAGMQRAWLPGYILNWRLPSGQVRKALLIFEPGIRAIEKFIRPRWQISETPIVDRINGLLIAILGIIVALPVPLINLAPALVIVVMGLGLLERDGLVQLFAVVFGLIVIAVIGFLIITATAAGP